MNKYQQPDGVLLPSDLNNADDLISRQDVNESAPTIERVSHGLLAVTIPGFGSFLSTEIIDPGHGVAAGTPHTDPLAKRAATGAARIVGKLNDLSTAYNRALHAGNQPLKDVLAARYVAAGTLALIKLQSQAVDLGPQIRALAAELPAIASGTSPAVRAALNRVIAFSKQSSPNVEGSQAMIDVQALIAQIQAALSTAGDQIANDPKAMQEFLMSFVSLLDGSQPMTDSSPNSSPTTAPTAGGSSMSVSGSRQPSPTSGPTTPTEPATGDSYGKLLWAGDKESLEKAARRAGSFENLSGIALDLAMDSLVESGIFSKFHGRNVNTWEGFKPGVNDLETLRKMGD
jgi:hypothetical protein